MKIIISKDAGYCMGVKRAFLRSFEAACNHSSICIYGEMVHNKFALKSLEKKEIKLIKNIDDIINNKKINCVIIRAHGISPVEEEKLKQSGKIILDFTCPKVKQVQLLAKELSNSNHTIILFGKKTHPEVIGIVGYCKNPYYIIKNIEDLKILPDKINKPAILCQTTMNSDTFLIICKILKKKYKDIKIHDTLCNSPIKIQESAIKLAKKVNAMIVVGDKLSANTTTLFEKVKNIKPTFFIETKDDINLDEVKKFKIIGITGGSSTPDWQMSEIKEFLEENIK